MEYIKANATRLGLADFPFDQYNIHIHVPEGASPKAVLVQELPC